MDRSPLWIRALAGAALGIATAAHAWASSLAISGWPPQNAHVGQAYSFTPKVSNPTHRTLYFRIVHKPWWATFSTTTGRLSGTPRAANVGATDDISIMVSDSVAHASLPEFDLRVWPATTTIDRPVISGTPTTSVTAGNAYLFQPSARDPAGRTLSFSVQHKPAWAGFSIAGGRLYGTPSSAQAGTYADVVISASNGLYSSSLPAFGITVNAHAPAQGTATLSWLMPTQNTNGSPLTDLAGVRIYYGSSESNLSQNVQLSGASTMSYTLSGLAAGTWYFGAQAYTTTGQHSALSPIVTKTIP
jgi:hypothetical protein